MKTTKIIKDQKQTRTTIPHILVKEANIESGHMAEWELKKGKLSANIISHKEFMKKVAEARKIENRTKNALEVKDEI